jgi:glycosyltransferase involved in cell wall biosynthesis
MHITFYKPGHLPVPPPDYGGTQRVIYYLAKTLIELGHQVTLIAHPRSHIDGAELRPVPRDAEDRQAWLRLVPNSTDLIHLWDNERPVAKKPCLVTVGGNGHGRREFHPNTVFVSRRHAANHGSTHFVYNGIDPADYAFAEQREDYAVFLAKASWHVKNLPGAARVARQAGVELRVLGSRNWPFNLQRRLPAIRGVRYYGMLGGREKVELLARARCLIFPVRWEEPFGIALTEALVSGCYVAGTPYGSLPEIVAPETGALSDRASVLADAVANPLRFDPAACRRRVLEGGFTHHDMTRAYLACYERILARGVLDDGPAPATRADFDPRLVLPWRD